MRCLYFPKAARPCRKRCRFKCAQRFSHISKGVLRQRERASVRSRKEPFRLAKGMLPPPERTPFKTQARKGIVAQEPSVPSGNRGNAAGASKRRGQRQYARASGGSDDRRREMRVFMPKWRKKCPKIFGKQNLFEYICILKQPYAGSMMPALTPKSNNYEPRQAIIRHSSRSQA